MLSILEKKKDYAIVRCDYILLKKLEDIYDSNPENYSSLNENIEPKEVLDFLDSLQDNVRTAKKISKKESL